MRFVLVFVFLAARASCYHVPRDKPVAASSLPPEKLILSSSSSPAGPEDFHITPHLYSRADYLPRDRLFRFVANLIVIEALKGDFESNFTDNVMRIRELTHPGLMLTASINVPGKSIPRRFIYWGLTRMMDRFVKGNEYVKSYYPMTWQGQYAGVFGISFGDSDDPEFDKVLNLTAKNAAQVEEIQVPDVATIAPIISGYVPGLKWSYKFYGSVTLPAVDLWMSVIGALVQAAELPDGHNITTFGGGFPPRYKVLQAAWSASSPPPGSAVSSPKLNKYLLTGTISSSLHQSQLQNDYRLLEVQVRDQGQLVVGGGDFPLPANAEDARNGVDVA
ncbi:MAG: hypothetical protein Q9202_003620 [Teloschistes flavicans]